MKALVALAALTLAALTLGACGASAYPEQYGFNFRSACERNGGQPAYCACVWDKVEAEIPVTDFVAYDEAARAGAHHPVADRLTAFSRTCQAPP